MCYVLLIAIDLMNYNNLLTYYYAVINVQYMPVWARGFSPFTSHFPTF